MFNAVTKYALLTLTLALAGCGGEKEEALLLYSQAETAIAEQRYESAVSLLDSIDRAFPAQVEVRRMAMHLRPKAVEGNTLREIEQCDSIMAQLQVRYNNLSSSFTKIDNPQLVEPYFVARHVEKPLFESTAIQGRITKDGIFYVVSSLVGKSNHTSVSLLCGEDEATSATVPFDGDRNYRSSGSEIITFIDSECDTLGAFARKYIGKSMRLRFNGNPAKTVTMTRNEVQALAVTHEYAQIISGIKAELSRKKLLDQMLQLSRDQMARTFDEEAIGGK